MDVKLYKYQNTNDLVIVPVFKEENLAKKIKERTKLDVSPLAVSDFKNILGTVHLIYSSQRLLLVGLGEKKQFEPSTWRIALHSALHTAQSLGVPSASLFLPDNPLALTPKFLELTGFATVFSTYQFSWYRKDKKPEKLERLEIIAPLTQKNQKAFANGLSIGTAANSARDLANHPGNIATPTRLAEHAKDSAKHYKFQCKILGSKEIINEGLGLIQGVAQGSEEPPKFIILDYGDKKKQPIILIGKGLTFDSGGVSIKPADKMEEMKYDMAGGATVIGIFEAVAKLKLPIRLIGIIPATENLLSGRAVKPGDILIAHDKTSVEIINTDAEGRLVIADAISFAKKYYDPKLIIDYATLTGAVLIALGDQYAGYFSNVETYDKAFLKAADDTYEALWPLPLAPEYRDQLKSLIADIKNIGDKGVAGAITAALFLEHFVGKTPWIHFDMAGTGWTMRPKNYTAAGATGWGVYLTVEFLRKLM